MIKRGVINDAELILLALVYRSSSKSAWAVHLPYNVFKSKKDISINPIADKNQDTTKYYHKFEIYYSLVTIQEIYDRLQLIINMAAK